MTKMTTTTSIHLTLISEPEKENEMQETGINAVFGVKRGRGRPKKAPDPHAAPTKCCATCARQECTSHLRPNVRAQVKDRSCVNYVYPSVY